MIKLHVWLVLLVINVGIRKVECKVVYLGLILWGGMCLLAQFVQREIIVRTQLAPLCRVHLGHIRMLAIHPAYAVLLDISVWTHQNNHKYVAMDFIVWVVSLHVICAQLEISVLRKIYHPWHVHLGFTLQEGLHLAHNVKLEDIVQEQVSRCHVVLDYFL